MILLSRSTSLTVFAVSLCLFQSPSLVLAKNSCEGSRDLLLTNGEIYTGDPANPNVSSVTIRNGRFVAVGKSDLKTGPCTEVIDLQKKRVVPGLIDSHAHWIRDGIRPGHDVREIETAFTKADVLAILTKKAAELGDLPADQIPSSDDFITALGGWDMRQFADGPITKADLDSIPTNRPIYLHPFLFFPGIINETGKNGLRAKTWVLMQAAWCPVALQARVIRHAFLRQ